MATILGNKVLNGIKTVENIKNFNSNIKNIFSHYLKEQIKMERLTQLIDDSINFRYSGEDWFSMCQYNSNNLNDLEADGYEVVSESDFIYADYNSIYKLESSTNTRYRFDRGDSTITFNDGFEDVELSFAYEDNVLIFFNEEKREIVLELNYKEGIEIIDFIYRDNKFYMKLKYQNEYFLFITHPGLEFMNNDMVFDEIEYFSKVKLPTFDLGHIVSVDRNIITFIDSNLVISKLTLGKKYCFIDNDETIYFVENKNSFINNSLSDDESIQSEHLFLYDMTSLFGLNELLDSDGNKLISTKNFKNKSDLFKFKFDDTPNGFINYFDLIQGKTNPSYKIDFNDNNFFKCYGNFIYDNESNVDYKISFKTHTNKSTINENIEYKLQLFGKLKTDTNYKLLKRISINTASTEFYFCNLKFDVNGIFDLPLDYEIFVSTDDDTSLKVIKKKYDLDIPFNDNEESIEYLLQNNLILQNNQRLKNSIKLDYIGYNGIEFNTKPFIINSGVLKLDQISMMNTEISTVYEDFPIKLDKNYFIDYKEKFNKDLLIGTQNVTQNILDIERIKFTMSLSLSDVL